MTASDLGISNAFLEDMDTHLRCLLESALKISVKTLDTVKPKPEKRYLCRKDKRMLLELITEGKQARAAYESGGQDQASRQALHATLNKLREERHALTKLIRIANAKIRKENFQKLVTDKPKLAHSILNSKMKDRVDLTVLRQQGTNKMLFELAEVLRETHKHFENFNQAPRPKPDRYTAEAAREYPWDRLDALDKFSMETHVGREGYGHMNLDDHIRNPALFQRCLRNTRLGKTPGPDNINNEMVRYLHELLQQAVHKMFILIWLAGHTPDRWKQSETLLLYKKGDPLQLGDYRPIALANTLYKVGTGLLTLSTYAEHFHLLSDCQTGFRKHCNTMRALQTTLNVYEDAKFHNMNVLPYTGYSNAFNTINQGRLLQILCDLIYRM